MPQFLVFPPQTADGSLCIRCSLLCVQALLGILKSKGIDKTLERCELTIIDRDQQQPRTSKKNGKNKRPNGKGRARKRARRNDEDEDESESAYDSTGDEDGTEEDKEAEELQRDAKLVVKLVCEKGPFTFGLYYIPSFVLSLLYLPQSQAYP
jgi:hypothetical protein